MKKKLLKFPLLIITLFASVSWGQSNEETDSIIVEKNLFHPERKKWVMETPKDSSQKSIKAIQKELSNIELFGTVISGEKRYAVLRTQKGQKRKKNEFYMVGDYINGYLITEIDKKNVVLRNNRGDENFIIFLNEGKEKRSTVKTPIKVERPTTTAKKSKRAPKKAQTGDFLKKRLERDIKVLKSKKSNLVRKQAAKDFKKLERLMPYMSDKEVREVLELKKELDRLSK
jgi:hypothetical protein